MTKLTKYIVTYKLERIGRPVMISRMLLMANGEIDLYKRFYRLHRNGFIVKYEIPIYE